MLDCVNLRNIKLDVAGLHYITRDCACKQTANEFRHFNHWDIVKDTVNRHTESGNQQSHGKHGNHSAVVKCCATVPVLLIPGLSFGSDFRLLRVIRKAPTGPPIKGTHDVAHCTCRHTDSSGIRRAPGLKDRAKCGSRTYTA